MINKIGLEAEFFLVNDKDELQYPGDHGFDTDDFVILGEIRALPGDTREQAIGNFVQKFYEVQYKAKKLNFRLDLAHGHRQLDPKLYSDILRRAGHKAVSSAKNIYPDLDILHLTDAVVDKSKGKILHHKISTGLHIHFSAQNEVVRKIDRATYVQVALPLNLEGITAKLDLYRREKETEEKVTATANLITKPVVTFIVKQLDEHVLPRFKVDEVLKYRHPGFYEAKVHGFEYRSLPFNQKSLDGIADIVDYSFRLLEELPL